MVDISKIELPALAIAKDGGKVIIVPDRTVDFTVVNRRFVKNEDFIAAEPITQEWPTEPKPLKIEAGKRYRLRDGSVARIVSTNGSDLYPVIGIINDQQLPECWKKNGRFLDRVCESESDIIAEVTD